MEGLSHHHLADYNDAVRLLQKARGWRATSRTALNDHSSRSHAIFSVSFQRNSNAISNSSSHPSSRTSSARDTNSARDSGYGGGTSGILGALHIVDLAGSERTKVSR